MNKDIISGEVSEGVSKWEWGISGKEIGDYVHVCMNNRRTTAQPSHKQGAAVMSTIKHIVHIYTWKQGSKQASLINIKIDSLRPYNNLREVGNELKDSHTYMQYISYSKLN